MSSTIPQYIFPETERSAFSEGRRVLAVLELILFAFFNGSSVLSGSLIGVWISLVLAVFFGFWHYGNLKYRKYCLAMWIFDGSAFHVYIGEEIRSVEIDSPFCISQTTLSFSMGRAVSEHAFLMLWKPGQSAPYEGMNGYQAMAKREAMVIPCNAETLGLLNEILHVKNVPQWPKSSVISK